MDALSASVSMSRKCADELDIGGNCVWEESSVRNTIGIVDFQENIVVNEERFVVSNAIWIFKNVHGHMKIGTRRWSIKVQMSILDQFC